MDMEVPWLLLASISEPTVYYSSKQLRHEIYQNSNSGNCHQMEWNIKITTKNIERRNKWQQIEKEEQMDKLKAILKRIAIVLFENLLA